jgi:hypothetical protein
VFWAKSVAPGQNVAQQLSALMVAVDANAPVKTTGFLEIQVPIEAGNVRVYIGDSNLVAPGNWGIEITAGQVWSPPVRTRDLSAIWIYVDTAGVSLGVTLE